jgi:ABC-type dipeptide/oligopeptide/nickel transport system ATPase component
MACADVATAKAKTTAKNLIIVFLQCGFRKVGVRKLCLFLGQQSLTHVNMRSSQWVPWLSRDVGKKGCRPFSMPPDGDQGFPTSDVKDRAGDLMEQVGLTSVANNPALNMSGGQQQRVAVARALAMNPDLVLADEPTGNLDTKSADGVFELLRQVNQRNGTTFPIVTQNMVLASRCDRIIEVTTVTGRPFLPGRSHAKGACRYSNCQNQRSPAVLPGSRTAGLHPACRGERRPNL